MPTPPTIARTPRDPNSLWSMMHICVYFQAITHKATAPCLQLHLLLHHQSYFSLNKLVLREREKVHWKCINNLFAGSLSASQILSTPPPETIGFLCGITDLKSKGKISMCNSFSTPKHNNFYFKSFSLFYLRETFSHKFHRDFFKRKKKKLPPVSLLPETLDVSQFMQRQAHKLE